MFTLISAIAGFLYPAYMSYKTLSMRPVPEGLLERWVMYWSTLATLLTVETLLPLLPWIPFYTFLRTIFLLFLVLPQTQGSTVVYRSYLEPFLMKHESDIDSMLERSKVWVWEEGRRLGGVVWETILKSLGMSQIQQQQGQVPAGTGAAPGSTPDGATPNPVQVLSGLWRTYGPTLLASGTAFIQAQQANLARAQSTSTPAAANPKGNEETLAGYTVSSSPPMKGSTSTSGMNVRAPSGADQEDNLARRRGTMSPTAELATPGLSAAETGSVGTGAASPLGTPKSNSGSGDEISHEEAEGSESGVSRGWFSGWSSPGKGYERVKSE